MCPENQAVFEKKFCLILEYFYPKFLCNLLKKFFMQFAEKNFCANCTKKILPNFGIFDLKFLYNLPIDKTRWL